MSSSLSAQYIDGFRFAGIGQGWQAIGDVRLRIREARLSVDPVIGEMSWWRDRVQVSARFDTDVNVDFLQFTSSDFQFGFNMEISVHRFLNLQVRSRSRNVQVYQYVPGLPGSIGVPSRNVLTDLAKSFNFFNIDDRFESPFNLRTIDVTLRHFLEDWYLDFSYTGRPELRTADDGRREYSWTSVFSFAVQWNPFPEVRAGAIDDRDGLQFEDIDLDG